MFEDAVGAFRDIFSAPFRVALYKSLGLTVLILIAAGVGLDRFVANAVASAYPWLGAALAILAGVGLFIGLGFLIAPLTALVAGFFFDELAALVEREVDPTGPPGAAMPLIDGLWLGARFAALSVIINLVALLLLLVPGVNAMAAPVFDHTGAMVLAITAIGPAGVFDTTWGGTIALALRQAGAQVSQRLGAPGASGAEIRSSR